MRGGLFGQTPATIAVVGVEAKLIFIKSFLSHPLETPFLSARISVDVCGWLVD